MAMNATQARVAKEAAKRRGIKVATRPGRPCMCGGHEVRQFTRPKPTRWVGGRDVVDNPCSRKGCRARFTQFL